jgi:hypothetical protein
MTHVPLVDMLGVGIVRLPKLQTSEQLLNVGEMRKACLELLGIASILKVASIHCYSTYVLFPITIHRTQDILQSSNYV